MQRLPHTIYCSRLRNDWPLEFTYIHIAPWLRLMFYEFPNTWAVELSYPSNYCFSNRWQVGYGEQIVDAL